MKNLIPHFIQEQFQQGNREGQFDALTMFVDVSGFTAMTQALMTHGHDGAEILAHILNTVFDRMVNAVYARGGFIASFAGDAFTAIFPLTPRMLPTETSGLHVAACAETIQAIFRRHGLQTTPYGQFTLQVKVGLSRGAVQWGIVGKRQHAYFFRGEGVDACAASEHHAEKGDIIFDEQIDLLIAPETRTAEPVSDGYFRLRKLAPSALRQLPKLVLSRRPRLRRSIAAHFLPDAVLHFAEQGEFRRVTPIFISFEGIAARIELDAWTTLVLDRLADYGGYFDHLDFGDKGGVMICGFGAPVAYENMAERALNCLNALKKDLTGCESLSHLKFRAGVTYGMAYAGIAGGQKRCAYTFYGEVVNLAARLMMQAQWGEILLSEPVRQKAAQFDAAG